MTTTMTLAPPMTRILLLVEDNPGDAGLVQELLEQAGGEQYQVLHALRLDEAVQVLRGERVDVVLLDLWLPDAVGVDTVRAVRAVAELVPIVVLTGTDDEKLATSCIDAGAQDYLCKGEIGPGSLRRAIGHAITRRRESQAEKMEAIGRLASGVAHDFNNLLTVIMGYAETLLERATEDDPAREWLQEICTAAQRAASLTGQLLAFSRKSMVAPVLLDVNAVVRELEKMLRRLIGEDIELIARLDPSPTPVKVDASHLQQVIVNLAVNARDAMPTGGTLIIGTRNLRIEGSSDESTRGMAAGEYVLLTISDDGAGMSGETQARIFQPFYTTKGVGKGTGLGLATVYGIVKQSGGHIAVNSRLGQGTTFRIWLPRCEEADEPAAVGAPRLRPAAGRETILLVEDEEKVRKLSRFTLESNGYHVLEARDVWDAVRLAETNPDVIDLVLTDVVMPQMSGLQLVEELDQVRPGLRVLFISGYTDDALGRYGNLPARTSLLQKPFTPAVLVRKVRDTLDQPIDGVPEA